MLTIIVHNDHHARVIAPFIDRKLRVHKLKYHVEGLVTFQCDLIIHDLKCCTDRLPITTLYESHGLCSCYKVFRISCGEKKKKQFPKVCDQNDPSGINKDVQYTIAPTELIYYTVDFTLTVSCTWRCRRTFTNCLHKLGVVFLLETVSEIAIAIDQSYIYN